LQPALEKINARALALQGAARHDADATGRFRAGAFILADPEDQTKDPAR